MGYRNYIGVIKKDEYSKIKSMTKDELFKHKGEVNDEDGHVGVYDIGLELHGMGKYVDQFNKGFFSPVFENKDLQNYFEEEHDFFIVNKEFLEHIINDYTTKVQSYYKKMTKGVLEGKWLEPVDFDKIPKEKLSEIVNHLKSVMNNWGLSAFPQLPFNLHEGDEVATSWMYEHAIFEIVRIYKTFDWENDKMYYYGY